MMGVGTAAQATWLKGQNLKALEQYKRTKAIKGTIDPRYIKGSKMKKQSSAFWDGFYD
jgi:hypothetical protein